MPTIKELEAELKRRNDLITIEREAQMEESMGVRAVLYKNLTPYLTIEDLKREYAEEVDAEQYNVMVETSAGWINCQNFGEAIAQLKLNFSADMMRQLRPGDITLMGRHFMISQKY